MLKERGQQKPEVSAPQRSLRHESDGLASIDALHGCDLVTMFNDGSSSTMQNAFALLTRRARPLLECIARRLGCGINVCRRCRRNRS